MRPAHCHSGRTPWNSSKGWNNNEQNNERIKYMALLCSHIAADLEQAEDSLGPTCRSQRCVDKALQKTWPMFPPPVIIYSMKNTQVGLKSQVNVGKSSAKKVLTSSP